MIAGCDGFDDLDVVGEEVPWTVLHGSGAARNAPYPRWNLGDAFEIRAAKFGHPIEYADANLGFGFQIFERACLEFGPDHSLPATLTCAPKTPPF
jgi:hypothetical protein